MNKILKRIGKIGKLNQIADKKIAGMWCERDIHYCEACAVLFDLGLLQKECLRASTNAHRHGRIWYRGKPELLYDFNQVIRACMVAHKLLDENVDVKERVFTTLRGAESI